ncbi:hypothetical protein HYW40_00450 [Candidatus Curtissbacteria bacterium]|nr:hypothetical protein [Candidatus Curtissbacteria bacterium]
MLKPVPLAASFAAATIVLYIIFYILQIVAPPFFKLALNSQFMGADFAALVPKPNLANFLGVIIAVGTVSWLFGYLLAKVYNKFSR